MKLAEIKEIIEELSADEKAALTAWLYEQDRKAWDQQIENDFSAGGAGRALLEQVDTLIGQGKTESFKVTRPRGKS